MFPFRKRSNPQPAPQPTQPAQDEKRDWLDALLGSFDGGGSLAGQVINSQSSLSVSAVRAAVSIIATSMGSLPIHLFQPVDDGGKEIPEDHPAIPLIEGDANPWTSAGQLRTQLTVDALLSGFGVAYVVRDSQGTPRELHRIAPSNSVTQIDLNSGEPSYRLSFNGQSFVAPYSDVIHLYSPVQLDGIYAEPPIGGLSTIYSASNAIGLSLALESQASLLMANAGRPAGVLSFPGRLGNEVAKRIKAAWQAATSGTNSGQTAVLEEGGKYEPLAFSSVDLQFAEMRAFQILEIARHFQVPPPFLAELGRATWGNFTQSGRQLVQFGLAPWARQWEAAFRRTLLSDADRKAGMYFHFDFDALQEGDLGSRAAAYSTLIGARVFNPNEARAREHMPAYAGGDTFSNPAITPGAPAGKPVTQPADEPANAA